MDAGFNRARLTTFSVDLPNANYGASADRARFYHRLVGELRALPGVQGATTMSGLPPQRRVDANDTDLENYVSPKEGPFENVDYYQTVGADYFETMGIPIVDGRGFTGTDEGGAPVAIVNETFVRTFFPDRSPLGQRLRAGFSDRNPWLTIVGVAKDVKQGGVDQKTGTELYFYGPQAIANTQLFAPLQMHLVLRSDAAGAVAGDGEWRPWSAPPTRRCRWPGCKSMDEVFGDSIRRPRLLAQLLGMFAGLALLLAAIGTYGVLAYMVTERRREIGIRMALGANQRTVVGDVMRQGSAWPVWASRLGLVGALALGRLVASLLFGVGAADPATLVAVMATIAAVAALASGLPAWRASRVDPTIALRSDEVAARPSRRSPALHLADGRRRVDARGRVRRRPHRHQRDHAHHQRHGEEGRRVGRVHADEQPADHATGAVRGDQADQQPHPGQHHAITSHEAHDRARRGAEGEPDAELALALRHAEGEHAVQPGRRNRERRQREQADHHGGEALRGDALHHAVAHPHRRRERQLRVEGVHGLAQQAADRPRAAPTSTPRRWDAGTARRRSRPATRRAHRPATCRYAAPARCRGPNR